MKAPAHLLMALGTFVTVHAIQAQASPVDPAAGSVAAGALPGLLTGGVLVALGALLPDADHPGSAIARVLGPLSQAVCWLVSRLLGGHRGLLHSLWPVLVLWWLLREVPGGPWLAGGYLSHLLLDSLTPAGIAWLWPLRLSTLRRWRWWERGHVPQVPRPSGSVS